MILESFDGWPMLKIKEFKELSVATPTACALGPRTQVQPMMFSVQAKAVGPHRQGSVVGLRQTMNRLAAIVIPPVMGVIADHWGAARSFVILGAILMMLCAPVTLITRRAAQTQ